MVGAMRGYTGQACTRNAIPGSTGEGVLLVQELVLLNVAGVHFIKLDAWALVDVGTSVRKFPGTFGRTAPQELTANPARG